MPYLCSLASLTSMSVNWVMPAPFAPNAMDFAKNGVRTPPPPKTVIFINFTSSSFLPLFFYRARCQTSHYLLLEKREY